MATNVPATASRDRAVRRQAQAQEHADKGGGGGIALLLLAVGAGGLGVWELLKSKPKPTTTLTCPTGQVLSADGKTCVTPTGTTTLTCPTGYHLSADGKTCVANGPVLPPGFPANWCNWSAEDKQIGIVWYRLLGRIDPGALPSEESVFSVGMPGELPPGIPGVAEYITQAPQGEFISDVAAQIANPTGAPAWFASGTYEDKQIAVTFERFLQRWPNAPATDPGTWNAWRAIVSGRGVPGFAREVLAPSGEFVSGVQAQAASYC